MEDMEKTNKNLSKQLENAENQLKKEQEKFKLIKQT